MEDNEKKEVIDTPIEETQEEVNEVEETTDEPNSNDDSTVYLEDYEKLKKENETLKAQKEHWRKKAEIIKSQLNKTNETNGNYLTRDEGILLAKGFDEDDIEQLRKIAGNGNLVEATKDPLFVAYKGDKERKEKSKKAQLAPSGSGPYKSQKPVREMTPEEHKAFFYKTIGKQ